ncbi:thioredoxin family protein [Pedobacter sp. MC2016-14]|uniref:thioredoxin family protein n=1 Tax=Pedobacter sp. MC2016-14 TaxID=2897327 RepID=UPI001E4CD89B|nr:thioredoxin family protein [Pedobacter sp. MC2016-14]MCD0490067.1 thioredoxin family protein [Pedobacter sp. MC2016-14]
MKKITFMISFVFYAVFALANADDGIQFARGSWAEITARAKNEKKLIFIDCYTSWCGPCKKLAAEIFPQKAVGDVFNRSFINYKVDMEKGEGIDLARKFHVGAYPTLLWIDANGNVVHRVVSFIKVDVLLAEAHTALNGGSRLAELEKQYEKNKKDPASVRAYVNSLVETSDSRAQEIATYYLSILPKEKYIDSDIFALIAGQAKNPFSPAVTYLFENRAAFDQKFGKNRTDLALTNIYSRYASSLLLPVIKGKKFDEVAFKQFGTLLDKEKFSERDMLLEGMRVKVFMYQKDWKGYAAKINSLIESGLYKNVVGGISSQWYQKVLESDCTDKEVFKSALNWVSFTFNNDFTFNMPYLAKIMDAKVKILERLDDAAALEKARTELAFIKVMEGKQEEFLKKQEERKKMIQAFTNTVRQN